VNFSSLKIVAVVLLFAGIAGGGRWFNSATTTRNQVIGLLPPTPDLSHASLELRDRILAADTQAQTISGALAGLIELSSLYHANGYLDTAALSYQGLADLDPATARWPHLHASILAGFGDAAPAVTLWQRAIELDPNYIPARLRLADLLLKDNQPSEAETVYRNVLELDRDNAWAQLGLARLELEAENWKDARRRLERIVQLTNYSLGYDLIVSLYERLGLTKEAEAIRGREMASGAYRDPTDPWLDDLMADCYDSFRLALEAGTKARHGDVDTAKAWLERAIAVSPHDVSAHFQLAGFLLEQRDVDGAATHYRRCTELDPEFADGWAQLSALQARRGNTAESQRLLEIGLKHCPASPGLYRMKARRLRDSGQAGAAIMAFRTAIKLRPNEPDPHLELGTTLLGMNRREEGILQVREALVWDPLNPTGLGIMAFNAIEQNNQTEANHWLSQVARQPRIERAQVASLHDAYRKAFGERWE
jgi:tetratricopeptide (TPR) repeat protein